MNHSNTGLGFGGNLQLLSKAQPQLNINMQLETNKKLKISIGYWDCEFNMRYSKVTSTGLKEHYSAPVKIFFWSTDSFLPLGQERFSIPMSP